MSSNSVQESSSWLRLRQRSPWVDRLAWAVTKYRRENVEQWSLRVVNRGLFLAVSGMILLLFVLEWVTSQLPGVNEIVIPTIAVPSSVDLGAVIHDTLLRQRGVLLDAAGIATLVFSAIYTARSLRTGMRGVAMGATATRVRWKDSVNVALAAGLIAILLLSWLLTLTTVVRTRAINALLNAEFPRLLVNLGKAAAVLLMIGMLAAAAGAAYRRVFPDAQSWEVIGASVGFGVIAGAANFVLFYAYIAALTSPNASGGVVLVFMIMAWVNSVSRLLLLMACWVAVGINPPAVPSPASIPVSAPASEQR